MSIWVVLPARPPGALRRLGAVVASWFKRRRSAPTAYQRCLAVHIHFAAPRGGLS